ncbi:MAG TPA: OmpA family protein [Candidatus Sulfotelmatobacter sp.]|jgi:OOP family OmpA-OmpF porin|nr:OmpA family protein [Candidatus Sulfotelmatobacter sp.]
MKFSRMIASLALPIVISGCASFPGTTHYLDELKTSSPSGAAFTQALSREYYAFAQSEKDQYDWFNSWHFAKKGLDAAHGTVVPPEDLSDWSFDDKQAAADLAVARTRLVKALDSNAPTRLPALTATAQVKYDCWVEQQDEGWQTEDIAACRKDFLAAMDAIEASAKPAAQPAAVKPATDRFQVFFDFNQAKLTPEAAKIVQEVAKAAKAANYPKLTVIGYTDMSGGADFNMRLSLKRAEAVRKALIAAGVPADRLSAEGRGKTDPLVPTKDGVREPQNRRVSVRFPG